MPRFDVYRSTEALEEHLGDPQDPHALISFERTVALDERDAYPEEACAGLDRWGLGAYYVPRADGGRGGPLEEVVSLLRTLARRDPTVAIAHGKSLLGGAAVWIAGSQAQRARVAELVRRGGQIALGLTEAAHGADLLACEVAAERAGGGFRLRGEKWLINNATRSEMITVYARTDPRGGPRGFSLFLVDKQRLAPGSFAHLPRVRTHGIRGADISGIRFEDAFVGEDAVIGQVGAGFELTLKLLQVSRLHVCAVPLGAADSALRIALDFAAARRLYGGHVTEIPQARRALAEAFVDLLACDCVALAATRTAHLAPAQLCVASPVAKYFIPVCVEDLVRDVSVVLGARYYLREGHAAGAFQKLVRDVAVVSLFDGSTAVNLHALALQLPHLLAREPVTGVEASVAGLFSLADVPDLRLDGLALSSRGRDDVVQGLARVTLRADAPEEVCDALAPLVARLAREADRLRACWRELAARRIPDLARSPEAFAAARAYTRLYAACACLHAWHHAPPELGELVRRGEWLAVALHRLVPGAPDRDAPPPDFCFTAVERELLDRHARGESFSLVPIRHATRTAGRNPS